MIEAEITEARRVAEARMGLEAPDPLVEEAVKLTDQKIRVKGLPESYAPCSWRMRLWRPASGPRSTGGAENVRDLPENPM